MKSLLEEKNVFLRNKVERLEQDINKQEEYHKEEVERLDKQNEGGYSSLHVHVFHFSFQTSCCMHILSFTWPLQNVI